MLISTLHLYTLSHASTQPIGMAVARVGTEMRVEPDLKQLYFSAIALGPVFLIPTVRERRSKMFEIGENSVRLWREKFA